MLGFRINSLKAKFSFALSFIFLLLFILSLYILISQSVSYQKQSLESKAKAFASLATKPIGEDYLNYYNSGFLKFRENVLDILALNRDITRVQIISVNNEVLFDSVDLPASAPSPSQYLESKAIQEAVVSAEITEISTPEGDLKEIITPFSDDFNSRPFSLRYFVSYESIYGKLNQTIFTIMLITLGLALFMWSSISLFVNRVILKPLGRVVLSAKQVSQGNLNEKIELRTGDELADLADSLNHMKVVLKEDIDRLKQLDTLKNEFVVLASHNLRTPLTIIKGYLSLLERNRKLTSDEKQALKGISQGTKSLEMIVESLLNLVSVENDKVISKAKINIPQLLSEISREFSDKAKSRSTVLKLEESGENRQVFGDEHRIKQAISAVVDNAIKFNKPGGEILIKIKTEKNHLLVSIADQGMGIGREAYERVFTKFNRATDSLTDNAEGLGIGLYLAKLVIEAHRGKIWFETSTRGTIFYISLPFTEER